MDLLSFLVPSWRHQEIIYERRKLDYIGTDGTIWAGARRNSLKEEKITSGKILSRFDLWTKFHRRTEIPVKKAYNEGRYHALSTPSVVDLTRETPAHIVKMKYGRRAKMTPPRPIPFQNYYDL